MRQCPPDDAATLAGAICGVGHEQAAWTEASIQTTLLVAAYAARGVRKRDALRQLLRACAEHTGRVLDVDALASGASVSRRTAYDWLDAFEAAGLLRRLPGWGHDGLGSRRSPRPILHLRDSALACVLLGIRSEADLARHPALQRLAESWLVERLIAAGRGTATSYRHFRTLSGRYVPLVRIAPAGIALMTIATSPAPTGLQSDQTMQRWAPHGRHVAHLARRLRQMGAPTDSWLRQVVHAGSGFRRRVDWFCPSWRRLGRTAAPVVRPGGDPQYTRSDSASSALSFR